MRMHLPPNTALIGSALLAMLAMIALGLALSWRAADQKRLEEGRFANCRAIEELKALQHVALSEEIAASEKFLREHPQGIQDIPASVIEEGIARDKRARERIAAKEC